MILTSEPATEKTISLMDSLVKQLAGIKFEGVIMYAVLMLVAGYICLEGYGIYKAALGVIGFAVGYSHMHSILGYLNITVQDKYMLLTQVIVGLICAGIAWTVLKAGIFIAVYHFVQTNFSAMLVAALAEKANIPQIIYPIFAALAGIAIAAFIAYVATKAERLVVVAVTAAVGGFAAVGFFMEMIPVFPVDIIFLTRIPATVWVFAKIFMSAAGFLVQGPTESK